MDVSTQVIAELQTSLSNTKEASRQTQQGLERQMQEAQSRWDEERRQLNRDADQTNKVRKRKHTLCDRISKLIVNRQLHSCDLLPLW